MLGSKLTNRQQYRVPQCSRQGEDKAGEASVAGPGSGSQPLPAVLIESSAFSGSTSGNSSQGQVCSDLAADNHFIVMHSMTTWAALLCIVDILDLACEQQSGFNVRAPIYTLPPAIAPTLQQQTVPHRPYVDMLPWSSLRNRILTSPVAIDEADFSRDATSGAWKVWGSTPWDSTGWEVGPEFANKWWFLMDDEIIRTTNFWRGQRGEGPLMLGSLSLTSC